VREQITLDRKEAEELIEILDQLIFDKESTQGITDGDEKAKAMLTDKLMGRIP